jgi:hypothetical protein
MYILRWLAAMRPGGPFPAGPKDWEEALESFY